MSDCKGDCVVVEYIASNVEFDHREGDVPARELAAIKKRWMEAESKTIAYGCTGQGKDCYCKAKGKRKKRISKEFHVEKVTTKKGDETILTGWVSVEIVTQDGDCVGE